jgi:hypothetical protein
LIGRFREGWADYEWRRVAKKSPKSNIPTWRGEDLSRRHLLVFGEQGLGDVLQFVRYLLLFSDRTCKITLLVQSNLVRLLRPAIHPIEVASDLEEIHDVDFQCPLMSLPHRFNTELSSIPNIVPYLKAEPELEGRWKSLIGTHGFKIGIAWQGNPDRKVDEERSIPLAEFARLSRMPGIRLISLQRQVGLDQLTRLPDDVVVETIGEDFDNGPDAFVDTAAIMKNLDLVITSDTSIAHLAGALACPTWVALKYLPDWRWLLDREDSPWYPTVRLFRQSERNGWARVFSNMDRELRALLRLNTWADPSNKIPLSHGRAGPSGVI